MRIPTAKEQDLKLEAMDRACKLALQTATKQSFDPHTNYLFIVYDETAIRYHAHSGTNFHAIGAMEALKKLFKSPF